MHTSHQHWHILGAGAIGTLIAFKLSQQKFTFSLISRTSYCDYRYFTDLNGVQHNLVGVQRDSIEQLIICTKSTQALAAFASIQSRLNPQSVVICLFNGLGAQQIIQQRANCPVFFATTTEGVSKVSPMQYAYKGTGETCVDQRVLAFIDAKNLPSMFKTVADIEARLINKLIINSLINPLTVIFDCKNGQLLSEVRAVKLMQLLAAELARWLSVYERKTTSDEVLKLATTVIRATANNSSSMRQDIKQGQVSEIDFINGYWVNNNFKDLNLEQNMQIIEKIKKIESEFP